MNKSEYFNKLKDPRWQAKRLEIFTRDEFTCQICGAKDKTLTVHHKYYEWDYYVEPWEYHNSSLLTLCQDCHKIEAGKVKDAMSYLVRALKYLFTSNELFTISSWMYIPEDWEEDVEQNYPSWLMAMAIGYAFHEKGMNSLIKTFLKDENYINAVCNPKEINKINEWILNNNEEKK